MSSASRWPLARLLILILAAAFLGLMADIRVEHVEVVREALLACSTILYSARMALACLLAAIFWNHAFQLLLRILFLRVVSINDRAGGRKGRFLRMSQAGLWTSAEFRTPLPNHGLSREIHRFDRGLLVCLCGSPGEMAGTSTATGAP
jgi:hypothetical protein